jgi:hypothetical protein
MYKYSIGRIDAIKLIKDLRKCVEIFKGFAMSTQHVIIRTWVAMKKLKILKTLAF